MVAWRVLKYLGRPFRNEIMRHYYNPLAEATSYRVYPRIIGPDDVVVEAGAHMGGGTYLLSLLAREVHAFEPNPYSISIAKSFLSRMRRGNVKWYQLALSDHRDSGVIWMKGRREDIRSSLHDLAGLRKSHSVRVDVVDLDDLPLRPDVITMDIEGSEVEALHGAQRCLAGARACIVEAHELKEGAHTLDSVVSILRNSKFVIKEIIPNQGNAPLVVAEKKTRASKGHSVILTTPK